jgi:hypothetical protein
MSSQATEKIECRGRKGLARPKYPADPEGNREGQGRGVRNNDKEDRCVATGKGAMHGLSRQEKVGVGEGGKGQEGDGEEAPRWNGCKPGH